MKKPKKNVTTKPEYEPTAEDLAALKRLVGQHATGSSARLRVRQDGDVPNVSVDHPNSAIGSALLAQALGASDLDFVKGIIRQLSMSQGREVGEEELNFILSLVKSVKPRDQIEAMLAAQMATVHLASMTFARRLAQVDNIPQQDSAERAFNKLTRTFVTQMEALKRYRTGGEQKVTVQHVSVNEGGQAIVGNVTQPPRENASGKLAPAALTDSRGLEMPMLKDNNKGVLVRRRSTR
jgi:hypothetical protein